MDRGQAAVPVLVGAFGELVEQAMTITYDELIRERGHLTMALLEVEWEAGRLCVVCPWPRHETQGSGS